MKHVLLLLLVVLVALLGLGFAEINPGLIRVNYYYGALQLPLAVTLLAALGVGVLVGLTGALLNHLKLQREIARLRRMVELRDQEVRNLRAIPIKDGP